MLIALCVLRVLARMQQGFRTTGRRQHNELWCFQKPGTPWFCCDAENALELHVTDKQTAVVILQTVDHGNVQGG